jgi:hypothetical protein
MLSTFWRSRYWIAIAEAANFFGVSSFVSQPELLELTAKPTLTPQGGEAATERTLFLKQWIKGIKKVRPLPRKTLRMRHRERQQDGRVTAHGPLVACLSFPHTVSRR